MNCVAKMSLLFAVLAISEARSGCKGPLQCPGAKYGTPPTGKAPVPSLDVYNDALKGLDMEAAVDDVIKILTRSRTCWPADSFPNSAIGTSYAGLFVRLAWHCSGTFRETDNAGGCAGGRMRFEPEATWDDNANLDKARALLWPIKRKYGHALSWGDLMVLAGTASILHMGGPVGEVCFGRIDDMDGSKSEPLGPGPKAPPCPVQGNCPEPLGTSTIGLIYVNPEGFLGNPRNLTGTAAHIRDVFGRMAMNDSETVALIGGGHAFGKAHGACDKPPCGNGKGKYTVTSGFEGPWTTDPYKWDNEFFQLLNTHGDTYQVKKGPGGNDQYFTPARPDLMMLTTDLALIYDPDFKTIVTDFATNQASLDMAFGDVWEKLTVRSTSADSWAAEKKCFRPTISRFISPKLRS